MHEVGGTDPPSPATLRTWRLLAVLAGAVGVALRARQLLLGQSLWLDEALLAHNILDRSAGDLLEPLSGQQGAPVGFLWAVKGVVETLGTDERLLRLPAFVAGVALLPVVWLLVRRLADERAAAFAVGFVALAPGLIRYSAELKQYSSDALAAAVLVLAAATVDRDRLQTLVRLAVAGAVAGWCSHPALLVCAAIGVVLVARAAVDRDTAMIVRLVGVGGAWAASVAVLYAVNLRDLTENDALTDYWATGFPDGLRPDRLLDWLWSVGAELVDEMAGHPAPAAIAALLAAAIALAVVERRRRTVLALVFAVPAVSVAFAVVELYPLRGRLALYVVPLLVAVLATLAASPRLGAAGPALLGLVLVGPAFRAADQALDPIRFPNSRDVIEHLAAHREDGDAIVLHAFAEAPFAVYGREHGLETDGFTQWLPPERCDAPGVGLDELTGPTWLVFSYTHSSMPPDEREILLGHLDAVARRVDVRRAHDALVAKYDFGAPPTDPDGTGRRVTDRTGCLDLR